LLVSLCAFLLTGLLQQPICFAGRVIFDDDWVPPKRDEPARANEPKPHTNQQPPVKPAPANPVKPAPSIPNTAQESGARRAIPEASEVARSRSQFKELFAQQLADHTLAGRRKLAKALLDAVPRTSDNPVDQYALLGGRDQCRERRRKRTLLFRSRRPHGQTV